MKFSENRKLVQILFVNTSEVSYVSHSEMTFVFFVKRNLTDNPPSPCCEWNVQLREIDELEVKVKSIAYLECHQEVCPTNRQCHVHLGNLLVKVSNKKMSEC